MSGGDISVSFDETALAHTIAALQDLQGPALEKKLRQGAQAGARALVAPMRAAAPQGATGNLRASIGVAKVKRRPGVAYVTAPLQKASHTTASGNTTRARKGYHRVLVIRGTQEHGIEARAQANRKGLSLAQSLRNVLREAVTGRQHVLRYETKDGTRFSRRVSHPATRANPFVARTGEAFRGLVTERMRAAILRAIERDRKR